MSAKAKNFRALHDFLDESQPFRREDFRKIVAYFKERISAAPRHPEQLVFVMATKSGPVRVSSEGCFFVNDDGEVIGDADPQLEALGYGGSMEMYAG